MEKIENLYKSLHIILTNEMNNEKNNQEDLYCDDDGEYKVYRKTCNKLYKERFH